MSEAVRLPNPVSTKQYLSHESATGERHELIDGIMYAMVGGSDWHNLISLNLAGALSQQLPDSCQVFEQSMKLRVANEEAEDFYYPDLLVSCDETDRDWLYRERPTILGEVLSPSTEREDRREKLPLYMRIPTVQEVILVAQDVKLIEVYRREANWDVETVRDGAAVRLGSTSLSIPVAEIYRRVAI